MSKWPKRLALGGAVAVGAAVGAVEAETPQELGRKVSTGAVVGLMAGAGVAVALGSNARTRSNEAGQELQEGREWTRRRRLGERPDDTPER